jgi:hypothetical protein
MEEKKELDPQVAGAAVVGFLGGVAVGRYLLDEILSEDELRDIKAEGTKIVYKCPKCTQELEVGSKFCSNCGVALEWSKRKKGP